MYLLVLYLPLLSFILLSLFGRFFGRSGSSVIAFFFNVFYYTNFLIFLFWGWGFEKYNLFNCFYMVKSWYFVNKLRISFWLSDCFNACCCNNRFVFCSYIFNFIYGAWSSFAKIYFLSFTFHFFHAYIGYCGQFFTNVCWLGGGWFGFLFINKFLVH